MLKMKNYFYWFGKKNHLQYKREKYKITCYNCKYTQND